MTQVTAEQHRRSLRAGIVALVLLCIPVALPADDLRVEDLGVVERQARIRGTAFSPGTAEYPSRLLIGFTGGDGTWIVNLRDGTSRKADVAGFADDYLQWPTFIGGDGKLFSSCGRGGLSIYDPAADSIRLIRPIPEARWLRGMAIGPDGAVYVSDYPTGSAAKIDPATGRVTGFGRQGGPFEITHVYGYSVGCDGRYVYTAVGKIPWYVVAYDTRTGKQRNLLQFTPADHPEVHQRGEKVFLEVTLGSPKKGEPATRYYRLNGGRAQTVDAVPRFDDSYVPGNDRRQPQVELPGRNMAITGRGATLRYQTPAGEPKTALLPLTGQDMTIERLAPTADGRLLVSTGPYGNVHRFDPQTKAFTLLGSPASKNVYDMLEVDGRVYFCGYPNSILGTFGSDGATLLGDWHEKPGSKHALFLVRGADGRLYAGNHNERESTGGALGWYAPDSGEFGGLHFPNDDCEYLTTARGGRLIVYASDFAHDPTHPEITKRDGRLLIYDTEKREVIREISPLADGSAGVVIEASPGVLFGVGLHEKLPVMFHVELATGKVGQRIRLSGRAYRTLARGPDGRVWFFIGDSLVRVDPQTFKLESVCRTPPGRMVFLGDDLYIAGTPSLRVIRNVAAKK